MQRTFLSTSNSSKHDVTVSATDIASSGKFKSLNPTILLCKFQSASTKKAVTQI
uniref:Uncharacterized protein n=1 Tax=Arundo donax TaxID=35708 RepID=A0A0A9CG51_ARUDO